jgi:uncharacterized membrane protein
MTWIGTGILILFTLGSWWTPYLMRRDLLFGVTVPPEFRDTQDARGIIRRYQRRVLLVGIALINLQIFLWSMNVRMDLLWPITLLLFSLGSAVAYVKAHNSIRAYAIPASGVREVELLPPARKGAEYPLMLLSGPAILAAGFALAFLIPDSKGQIPLLTGWSAIVARWTAIDGLVDNPLSFTLGAWLGTFIPLVAFRFGTRRSPAGITNYRRVILRNLSLVNAAFAALAMWMLGTSAFGHVVGKIEFRVALTLIILGVGANTVHMVVLRRKENMALASVVGHPIGDRTPDEAWLWGIFYHNPDDPALFVERRSGPGYTMNFGHLRVWLMIAGFVIVLLLPLLFK